MFLGLSNSIASDSDDVELDKAFSELDIGYMSDYNEETLETANTAFFDWEERVFDSEEIPSTCLVEKVKAISSYHPLGMLVA